MKEAIRKPMPKPKEIVVPGKAPMLFYKPEKYCQGLSLRKTQAAIQELRNVFQKRLCQNLSLVRASAPLFVEAGTGINDDLNGIERKASFTAKVDSTVLEVPNSLAKWKRMALAKYGFNSGEGIWTDMNAIRPDEQLTNIHSIYVDQWDWERVMIPEDRTIGFLQHIVKRIYGAMKDTEEIICNAFDIPPTLRADKIAFVTTEEAEERYPNLSRKEREHALAEMYGAVFLIGIGAALKDGEPHDGRAPDYDDWITATDRGKGLNGDILVWNPVLETSLELSSMGIRVDKDSLVEQLRIRNATDRLELSFHQMLMNDELPQTVGGGIGQSRYCMQVLRKAHIGEVQSSYWPKEMREEVAKHNIHLL